MKTWCFIGRKLKHIFALLITAFACASSATSVNPQAYTDIEIKAAFLYNFTNFVTWPEMAFANKKDPFTFCILGDDGITTPLKKIVAGEKYNHRAINAKVIDVAPSSQQCQIVYVGFSHEEKVHQIIDHLRQQHVLSVSDIDDFAHRGGIISFAEKRNKLHLVINLQKAIDARLKISSQLLKLATVINRTKEVESV